MKITQTDSQLELKTSGAGQVITGVVLIAAGIGMAIVTHSPDADGKKAPVWVLLVAIAIALAGVAAIIFAKNRSVTIQKGGNTTVSAKRLIGGTPQSQTVPTASIVAVRLATYVESGGPNNNGNPSNSRRSTLSLVLNNNDLVEVGSSSGNSSFSFNGLNVSSLISRAPLSKEANQTAGFLGVPLQADDTSSIAGAVRSVRNAFQQGSPDPAGPPAQTTSFNPEPPAQPAQQPASPAPAVQLPQPQAPLPPTPPAIPQQPSGQVPPSSDPGTPPPYTPTGQQ